jgi:hypothetical protein
MIDKARLEVLIAPHERVLVICPRRSRKSVFLCDYVNENGDERSIVLGLTGGMARELGQHVTSGALCVSLNAPQMTLRRSKHASLLCVDEALFHRFELLAPHFHCCRVLAISSQSPWEAHATAHFAAAGFVVIDAPLIAKDV